MPTMTTMTTAMPTMTTMTRTATARRDGNVVELDNDSARARRNTDLNRFGDLG